jgi:hypothetical protein
MVMSSPWEAEIPPLDDTRETLGFGKFYIMTIWRVTVAW